MNELDRTAARVAWSCVLSDAGVGHSLQLVDALVDLLAGLADDPTEGTRMTADRSVHIT